MLGGSGLIISLITFKLFPDRWVYYGTLHSIAIGSLVGLLFIKVPKTSLILTIVTWIIYFAWWKDYTFYKNTLLRGDGEQCGLRRKYTPSQTHEEYGYSIE